MDIPFTKEQYRTLLKITFLGEWVANARKTEGFLEEISDIQQHIFSFAGRFSAGEFVEKRGVEYESTEALDTIVYPIIEEYDALAFWEQLMERLADRDLVKEHGEENIGKLDPDEYESQIDERVSVYEEEFEEFGLARLQIVED